MVKLSSIRLDHEKESGVWAELGDGLKFKIARWGSPRVERYMEDLRKKFRSMLADPSSTGAKQCIDNMVRLTVANRALVGWENLDDDDGNSIPFSREKALEILEDPANALVLEFILGVSRNNASYKVEADNEDLENS